MLDWVFADCAALSLAVWPAVVVIAAGLNMALSRTFSWSELALDAIVGAVAGAALFAGLEPGASDGALALMAFSHGLPGLGWWLAGAPAEHGPAFVAALAGLRIGATVAAGLLDRRAVIRGVRWGPGAAWGLPLALLRGALSPITSAVGLTIWLVGWLRAVGGRGRVGFAAGVLIAEFEPDAVCGSAVSLGCTVHGWAARAPVAHELYHARQYLYLGDWLVPFWLVGCVWGLASAVLSGRRPYAALAFGAARGTEVGNPLEVAAYRV